MREVTKKELMDIVHVVQGKEANFNDFISLLITVFDDCIDYCKENGYDSSI